MFCSKCGMQLDPSTRICPSCGASQGTQPPPVAVPPQPVTPIPNHLVGAILTTVFCCLPFGVVSIVYASSVNSKQAVGDFAGAKHASDKAATWMWVAFWVGLVVNILGVIIQFGAALADM